MHETIQLLLDKDDVTWKQILYDLVRNEQMNPWDIDVSVLSQKYIETIKGLKQHDFRISGKVLLAAAIRLIPALLQVAWQVLPGLLILWLIVAVLHGMVKKLLD